MTPSTFVLTLDLNDVWSCIDVDIKTFHVVVICTDLFAYVSSVQ